MKVLATFSGKFGDILWSLPTVRELAKRHGGPVDFCIMPMYRSLLALLEAQPYIKAACVSEKWGELYSGSPYGDQPWEAPVPEGAYDIVYHLTYRAHPVFPLMLHIAGSVGVTMPDQPLPFIDILELNDDPPYGGTVAVHYGDKTGLSSMVGLIEDGNAYVTYGFNADFAQSKRDFICRLMQALPDVGFVDVGLHEWCYAARLIKASRLFVGCRSANHVLALGLGQKILIYEPHLGRRVETFGCPYYSVQLMPAVSNFEAFLQTAQSWLSESRVVSA